jgi:hypothetical protein
MSSFTKSGRSADDPIPAIERPGATDDLLGEVVEHDLAVVWVEQRRPALDRPVECGVDPEDRVETRRA